MCICSVNSKYMFNIFNLGRSLKPGQPGPKPKCNLMPCKIINYYITYVLNNKYISQYKIQNYSLDAPPKGNRFRSLGKWAHARVSMFGCPLQYFCNLNLSLEGFC